MKILNPLQYDHCLAFIKSLPRPAGNPRNSRQRTYKDVLIAFDIETTRLPNIEQSFMYVWMLHIHHYYTIVGRTWEEFINLLQQMIVDLNGDSIVIYVHNLSYEFQFLRGIYTFSNDEVFAIDRRKVLKCFMHNNTFEFRCSYLHTNMSLLEFTSKMKVEHVKQSGVDFDYSIIRYPWTPLSEKEIKYCVHDVVGLCEALEVEMAIDGDTLYTIPITSTGYVRRDVKHAMREVPHYYITEQFPDFETYTMLREAFRGGDTHANRYFAGMILENVHSMDRSSSYPECLCNCLFPISFFRPANNCNFDRLMKLIAIRKKAVLCTIRIWGLRLIDKFDGAPYLSKDKCRNIIGANYAEDFYTEQSELYDDFDNGRILNAKYLETTVTDIDLKIIINQYDFDNIEPIKVKYARYGKLPQPIIEVVIKMYKGKTELKDIPGQEVYYMKSKNKLNSVYGMMAQNPIKHSILYNNCEWDIDNKDEKKMLSDQLHRAFLVYQWGVWTTAHARKALRDGIAIVGHNFVYCDTDSVKFIGEANFSKYNEEKVRQSKESGAFATDKNGITHYMGVYEDEGTYTKFCTLGAKKYVYEKKGKLCTTIAGVSKKYGGEELSKAGGIEKFKPGFTFVKAGGTESLYNDDTDMWLNIDGHDLHITSNVVIRDSTYTLGYTKEYRLLLEHAKFILDKQFEK